MSYFQPTGAEQRTSRGSRLVICGLCHHYNGDRFRAYVASNLPSKSQVIRRQGGRQDTFPIANVAAMQQEATSGRLSRQKVNQQGNHHDPAAGAGRRRLGWEGQARLDEATRTQHKDADIALPLHLMQKESPPG
jgi:hypothetical protein